MFEHVREHDVVVAVRQRRVLEARVDELRLVAQTLPRLVECHLGGLDAGHVVEARHQTSGEIAFEAA
ncbi:hypothetical protein D3C72_2029260 [compost metagenome]